MLPFATTTDGGLPGATRDRAGRWSYTDYDQLKRPIRVQDVSGNTLELKYDAAGNVAQMLDAKGKATRFAYDAWDRLIAKSYADNSVVRWSYDAAGRRQSRTDAKGRTTRYGYDESDRLTLIDYPNMADIKLAYDARERVSSVTDALGVTRLAYNDVGRVTAIDGPWDNDTVRYTYDNIGRKSGVSVDGVAGVGGQSNAYAYDTLGRLDTITTQAGLFDYNYSSLGKQGEMLMPNGTKATYAYDTLDRLTSVAHWAGGANPATATPLWRNSYAHEEAPYALRGVQTSALEEAQGQPSYKKSFAYSNDDQLTGALTQKSAGAGWQSERSQSFAYDAMGNRTSSGSTDVAGVRNTSYTANALNQLTALNTTVDATSSRSQLDYDKAGNLTSAVSYNTTGGTETAQGRTVYEYDDIDRLSAVETCDAADVKQHRTEWVYDSASRKRIARDADWQNGAWTNQVEKRFVFDGLEVVQERDATNAVKSDLVWAGAVGGLLSRTRYTQTGPQKRFYHYDGAGNVIGLSDAAGAVTARYRYDVYGQTLEAVGVDAAENPVRCGTKWVHGAGGLNLE